MPSEDEQIQNASNEIDKIIERIQNMKSINVEGGSNNIVFGNVSIGGSISGTDSKDSQFVRNVTDLRPNLLMIGKLTELKLALKNKEKSKVKETLSWFEKGSTIIYNTLSAIAIIRQLSGM